MHTPSDFPAMLNRVNAKNVSFLQEHGLTGEVGKYKSCAVLRISKPAWSHEPETRGLFFSIWLVENELPRKGAKLFHYNLHALKLGSLPKYKIKPVKFARLFRSEFKPSGWPNVSTDFGPQNLFEGWQLFISETFETDASDIITKFVQMHSLIDNMLLRKS